MLMQLLHNGGIPALTDGQRVADDDNPRGYFEYEPATNLSRDATWVPNAHGKVVKLALPLVQRLPAGELYRLLIIDRDLREVVASQRKMLERLGRGGANLSDEALMREYERQRDRVAAWLNRRPEIAVLPVRYEQVLADSLKVSGEIAGFLGRPFQIQAAAAAVDPSLRRQFTQSSR